MLCSRYAQLKPVLDALSCSLGFYLTQCCERPSQVISGIFLMIHEHWQPGPRIFKCGTYRHASNNLIPVLVLCCCAIAGNTRWPVLVLLRDFAFYNSPWTCQYNGVEGVVLMQLECGRMMVKLHHGPELSLKVENMTEMRYFVCRFLQSANTDQLPFEVGPRVPWLWAGQCAVNRVLQVSDLQQWHRYTGRRLKFHEVWTFSPCRLL